MTEQQTSETQEARLLAQRFIDLANEIKDEGKKPSVVNTALQLASCAYTTYLTAGNEGYLKQSGIDKLTQIYKINLTQLQAIKKAKYNPEGKD